LSFPPKEDRRALPRFKVWVACSVLPSLSDEDFRQQAVLGYVKDLSREAVAVLLSSNETYGVDASSLGKEVQMNLALPIGYVRLSATLVRCSPDETGKSVFVFRIQESKERAKYEQYLDSLESELLGASKDSLRHRLSIIETKLDPD
jgi:PilZ domain-containing protein